MDKIPTQEEYENALEGDDDLNKKIVKLSELNELAYEDLILLINTSSSVGKVAFGLVKNVKSEDFPERNCKVVWDRLVSKYALHTALSLLKLKSELHNSRLELIDKDPNKWISHLEGLRIQMTEFGQKGYILDEDFMIHVLNNLPMEYTVILNGLKNRLTATRDNALTTDLICEKLNHRYEKIKSKKAEKNEKEKALNAYNKQYKQQCWSCGKYSHKPGNWRCPKNRHEKEENEKKIEYKNRKFKGICYHCGQKGHIIKYF